MDSDKMNRDELAREVENLRERLSFYESIGSLYKQAEQDLKIMEKAVNSSFNGIVFSDLDGNITYVNAAFLRMWGYDSFGDVVGKPAVDFWQTRDEAANVLKVLSEKENWVGELVARKKDGSLFDTELSANLIRNFEGNPVMMMGSFVDISRRKKYEEELKRSEEKWSSLVKNAPDIIMIADREGYIQFINHTVPGVGEEEPIGRKLYDYIDAEYREVMSGSLEKMFKGEKGVIYELKGVGPDGGSSWYEGHLGPIEQDGQVVAAAVIVTDITERKKAEEELRFIFENMIDGVLLADENTKKFYIGNRMICSMLGRGPDEIKNLGVSDIHPEEDLPYVLESFDKQARGEITLAKDIPVKRKDGSVFYADVNSTPVSISGKTYLMGVFRDMTERKKAEHELKERQELLDNANKELKRRVAELEGARGHIKRLEGMFPICAGCKKMLVEGNDPKDPKSWVPLERYISERTDANFTHGMCPDCMEKIYKKGKKPGNEAK